MDPSNRKGGLRFGTHRVSIPVPRRAAASSPPDPGDEGSTARLHQDPTPGDATIQDAFAPVFEEPIAPAHAAAVDDADDRLATIPESRSFRVSVDQSGVTASGPATAPPAGTAEWAPAAPRVRVPAPRGGTASTPPTESAPAPPLPSAAPARLSGLAVVPVALAVTFGICVGVAATLWFVR